MEQSRRIDATWGRVDTGSVVTGAEATPQDLFSVANAKPLIELRKPSEDSTAGTQSWISSRERRRDLQL